MVLLIGSAFFMPKMNLDFQSKVDLARKRQEVFRNLEQKRLGHSCSKDHLNIKQLLTFILMAKLWDFLKLKLFQCSSTLRAM